MTKSFWSKKRAEAFAETLRGQDFESVVIWSERDNLNNCTRYIVKWF